MKLQQFPIQEGPIVPWIVYGGEIPEITTFFRHKPDIVQKFSKLYKSHPYLLKLIFAQKPADYFRKYHACQAKREFFSSKRLSRIGIDTPEVYGYAFSLIPFTRYDSVLIMEEIDHVGSLSTVLESIQDSQARRSLFLQLTRDLKTMIDHGVYHKDAHYGNILVRRNGQICWIDNDIGTIYTKKGVDRLLKRFITGSFLEAEDREVILETFGNYL